MPSIVKVSHLVFHHQQQQTVIIVMKSAAHQAV